MRTSLEVADIFRAAGPAYRTAHAGHLSLAMSSSIRWRSGVTDCSVGRVAMMKFLSLKELHRLPPLPQGKTSAQARYLTATTTAAQRLRAM